MDKHMLLACLIALLTGDNYPNSALSATRWCTVVLQEGLAAKVIIQMMKYLRTFLVCASLLFICRFVLVLT